MRWKNTKGTVELAFEGLSKQVSAPATELLHHGLAHHQAGRLQEAEVIYQSVLQAQPRHPDALHLLGVIAHQAGKHDIAVDLIESAIKVNPNVPDFYHNCAEAYRALHSNESAVDRYEQALAIKPDFTDAHHNLGATLMELGRCEDAIAHYKQALAIKPDYAEAYNNLGVALHALDRQQEAIGCYEHALAIKPDYAEACYNYGLSHQELGQLTDAVSRYEQATAIRPDYAEAYYNQGFVLQALAQLDEAIARYEQAIIIRPDYADAHNNLGVALQALGREDEAIVRYEQAIVIKPDYAEAYLNLGIAWQELGQVEDAVASYKQALAIKPDYVEACYCLAEIYENLNQIKKTDFYVQKVFQIQPDNPRSNRLAAILLRRQGKYTEALELLRAILLLKIDPKTEHSIHFEMGKIYDIINDSDSAMHHFSEGNCIQENSNESAKFNKNIYIKEINNIENKFTKKWVQSWPDLTLNNEDDSIVFLAGFPRSGTTLLDQILDGHPGIQVIEERPMINCIAEKLSGLAGGYPTALASLNETDISELRKQYLDHAEKYMYKQTNTIIIDKLPLNTIHIGLIYRLFPKSRIILALRHPCDVCLSNFMQQYKINHAMANFFTLNDTAELYNMVMALWRKYVELFPLNYIEVKYEFLVDDIETQVKRLLNFLGMDWDPLLLDYANHAKNRKAIKTPSYSQVTEPIYTDALYRWHRYEQYLLPVMNELKSHITYFEYDNI